MKNLTQIFTEQILQENKGKNIMLKTKLISIQLSSSDPTAKEENDAIAMQNKLSVVDFSSCEQTLKDNGYMSQNDTIVFSKTDWNPALESPPTDNAGMTKSASVSYKLYYTNGTEIDRNLCANTTTAINIPLKNMDQLNITQIDSLASKGYNAMDPESPYYNDRCIPIRTNDTEATIEDKRSQYGNVSLGCQGNCQVGGINTTNGYVNCICNSTDLSQDIGAKFENSLLSLITETNIEIAKCISTVFTYVSLFI